MFCKYNFKASPIQKQAGKRAIWKFISHLHILCTHQVTWSFVLHCLHTRPPVQKWHLFSTLWEKERNAGDVSSTCQFLSHFSGQSRSQANKVIYGQRRPAVAYKPLRSGRRHLWSQGSALPLTHSSSHMALLLFKQALGHIRSRRLFPPPETSPDSLRVCCLPSVRSELSCHLTVLFQMVTFCPPP